MPPPFTLPGPIPFFSLGTFTHQNFEVDDPSLTSVQLDVVLAQLNPALDRVQAQAAVFAPVGVG